MEPHFAYLKIKELSRNVRKSVIKSGKIRTGGEKILFPAVESRVFAEVFVFVTSGTGDNVDDAVALLPVEEHTTQQAIGICGIGAVQQSPDFIDTELGIGQVGDIAVLQLQVLCISKMKRNSIMIMKRV